jgi:hypothetical protein
MKKTGLGQGPEKIATIGVIGRIVFPALELRRTDQIIVEQARYQTTQSQKEWTFFVKSDAGVAQLVHPADAVRRFVDDLFREIDAEKRATSKKYF